MSFEHLSNMESQSTAPYSDDPAFDRTINTLSNKLFNLKLNISRISSTLALLGTNDDSEATRDKLKNLLEQTRDGFKEVSAGVKKIKSWPDVTPSQKFAAEKLARQFTASMTDFQTTQRIAAEKQRQYIQSARHAVDAHMDSTAVAEDAASSQRQQQELLSGSPPAVPLVAQQLALAEQSDVDFQESLIIEREEEIREIERGIGELNEIFRDLGTIVSEQGTMVDRIEENVMNVRDHVESGHRELRSANRWQKGARKRACCLMLILGVVGGIVVLAVVVG